MIPLESDCVTQNSRHRPPFLDSTGSILGFPIPNRSLEPGATIPRSCAVRQECADSAANSSGPPNTSDSEYVLPPRSERGVPPSRTFGYGLDTRVGSAAALYLRVSTEDQDLAGQERDLRAEAERRGWSVAAVYAEKVSGTGKVERKEYERLLADARNPSRPWTHLLVWSLDRWSREERFSRAVTTIEGLEALGVRFHSLGEPTLDSSEEGTPNMARDLLRAILPVIAAFESRRKSERVRVAMREIREGRRRTRSGRPPGRPRRVTEELAERAKLLREQGLAWADVAQHVGLPAETCRRAVYARRVASGTVPAAI